MSITLTEAKEKLETLQTRLRNAKDKSDAAIDRVVGAAVTSAGAATVGVLDGWQGGEAKVAGVHAGLIIGLGAHAMSMFSGSKYAEQFAHFGNGAAAAFTYTKAKAWGERMKANKDQGKPLFSGEEAVPAFGPGSPVGVPYGSGMAVYQGHAGELGPLSVGLTLVARRRR